MTALTDTLIDALRGILDLTWAPDSAPEPSQYIALPVEDGLKAIRRAREALELAEREMRKAHDIASELRALGPLVSSGYECPAAGTTMWRAADRIEALERELAEAKAAVEAEITMQCPHDGGFDRELGPVGCLLRAQGLECVCEGFAAVRARGQQ